ncbi:HEAT repeat domain-containing protein [bacterium]|nr:HEAT repeat domain-containing protein [bacterium]
MTNQLKRLNRVSTKSRRDGSFQPAMPVAGKRPNKFTSPVGTVEAVRIRRAIIKSIENGNQSIAGQFGKLNVLGKRVAVTVCLKLLTHPDEIVVCEAANHIPDGALAIRGCIRLLDGRNANVTRQFAAYALGRIGDERAVEPLLKVLLAKEDDIQVRAHAAEALGMILMILGVCKRPAKQVSRGSRQRVTRGLIRCLEDPSADVRFWCSYALGSMQAKSALEELDKLAKNDRRRAKGFWSVAREARDAAQCIRQGFWPDL